jgi:hypothetical protein
MVNEGCVGSIKFEGFSMRLKSTLALIGLAVAFGLAGNAPASAGGCRGWGGPCGAPVVRHHLYYPNYYNVYYAATFAPDPYPYVYVPRGYWPRYERPYRRYARRYWSGVRTMGCCDRSRATAYYAYPVPAPVPVPVGCGWRCRGDFAGGYLK